MVSQGDKTADLFALKACCNKCLQNSLSFRPLQQAHESRNKRTAELTVASERSLVRQFTSEAGAAFSWCGWCGSARIHLRAGNADANAHGRAVTYRFQVQTIEQPSAVQPSALAG
jgi:hypothetical protein